MTILKLPALKLIYLCLVLTILFSSCLYAQSPVGSFKGIVVDVYIRQPLKDVIVKIQRTSAEMVTGVNGEFIFSKVPAGTYILEFMKDGYRTSILPNQAIMAGKTTFLQVEMVPGSGDADKVIFFIGGIEITGKKELLPEKTETVTHIKSSDIEHIDRKSVV